MTQSSHRLWHFHGGLKLRHHKAVSIENKLKDCSLADYYYLPLRQYSGSHSNAIVKVGDKVLKGQCIADSRSPRSSYLHAPTSGKIIEIANHPIVHPSGLADPCIVLQADGNDQWLPLHPFENWQDASQEEILQRIKHAGLVGLGGAAFPTHIKLQRDPQQNKLLIINGAECEPYISCDEILMRERAQDIVDGAAILCKTMGFKQCIIAIEDYRKKTSAIVQETVTHNSSITLIKVPTIYPEGGEKQLIRVITGQEIPSGKSPIEQGVVCLNVATVAAIKNAVIDGKPLLSRIVTVTGKGIKTPQNLNVRIGTPIAHVINEAGGYTQQVSRLLMGGPMMGIAVHDDSAPVVKACNCLLALREEDSRPVQAEMPCIRCMECVKVCPAQLLPQQLFWQIQSKNYTQAESYHVSDCIECGCCAYVCPSHIPLVDYYRHAKAEIKFIKRNTEVSNQSKQHFNQRQERLESEKLIQQQKRKEKRDNLATMNASKSQDKQQIIADAIERSKRKRDNSPQERS